MSDISIFPIFNQSAPGIWDDFLRIRIAAQEYNHNIFMSEQDIVRAQQEYADDWRRFSGNFAFGAYDDNRMIGCVNGVVSKSVGMLYQLHVLPEYQHQRIGLRLLNAAQEAVATMSAGRMQLVSLTDSRGFYTKMGYKYISGNEYSKHLHTPHCSCVPVFHCCPTVARACNIAPETLRQIKTERLPMFVTYDWQSKITGHGLVGADGRPVISAPNTHIGKITQRTLGNVINLYLQHMSEKSK